MPRTKYGTPKEQLDLENELRNRYGGMMTAKDVGRELGMHRHEAYSLWLADVSYVLVNNRKRYRVTEVAKKIYLNTVHAV